MPPRVTPPLLDTWRNARLWIALPGDAVEVARTEDTEPGHFPTTADLVHLVTAWNPDAIEHPRAENEQRHQQLLGLLDESKILHWDAAGYDEALSWIELGLALPGLPRARAVEIAGHFGQLAIYEWTREELRVVDCDEGAVLISYPWSATTRERPPTSQPSEQTTGN